MIKIDNNYISEAMVSSVTADQSHGANQNGSYLIIVNTVNGEIYKERFTHVNDRDLKLSEIIRNIDRYNNRLDITAALMSLKTELQALRGCSLDGYNLPEGLLYEHDNKPVSVLGLSDIAYNSLKRFREGVEPINTLKDVRMLGWDGLRRLKGMGSVRLNEIRDKYEAYTGLSL